MKPKYLEERVDLLESTVAGLAGLPRQFETLSSQFSQLRADVTSEISAVRVSIQSCETRLGTRIDEAIGASESRLTERMADAIGASESRLTERMADAIGASESRLTERMAGAIGATEARLASQMRALHEEALDRITTIGEGRPPARRARKPR